MFEKVDVSEVFVEIYCFEYPSSIALYFIKNGFFFFGVVRNTTINPTSITIHISCEFESICVSESLDHIISNFDEALDNSNPERNDR